MLLGSHPRICAPSETPWIFGSYGEKTRTSLRDLVKTLCDSKWGPVRNIAGISRDDVHLAAHEFLLTLFAARMRAEAKDVIILKTPDDIFFTEEILKVFPSALIIHIKRDVRDVALSTLRTSWGRLNLFGPASFESAVKRWVDWERRLRHQEAVFPDRIVSIRYEDLLTTRLHVSFDPRMVNYRGAFHDTPSWEAGSSDALKFERIQAERAFAHRRYNPTPEQRQVISNFESDIVALGYEPGWAEESDEPLSLLESAPGAA